MAFPLTHRPGIHAADRLVSDVLLQLPGQLAQILPVAIQRLSQRHQGCQGLHHFLVQMGQRATSYKEEIKEHDGTKWDETKEDTVQPQDQAPSLVPFPLTLQLPAEHSFGECASSMFRWLSSIVVGDRRIPIWLSSYQLLIHFQGTTGGLGLH